MCRKEFVKRLVGERNINRYKRIRGFHKHFNACLRKGAGKIVMPGNRAELVRSYELDGKSVFFGYYDLQQFNAHQNKILVHAVQKDADPSSDPAEIFWIDFNTDKWHKITDTCAWNWQQGSRLRWHPANESHVLVNNIEQQHYVTQKWDVLTGSKVATLPLALYDLTPDSQYGLNIDFARLQRLRPGYGYSALPESNAHDYAPIDNGISLLDIETGKTRLLFSLRQLSEEVADAKRYQHYINHISVSPDGKKFMFFHLWTKDPTLSWKLRCYVSSIDGTDLQCLESEDVISHYCWKDCNTLLLTKINRPAQSSAYALYNTSTGEQRVIENNSLRLDGHPTAASDGMHFFSDTYPLKNNVQYLFRNTFDGTQYEELLAIYSDPRMFGEQRCDLHPRLSKCNQFITIDSTYQDQRRKVLVLRVKERGSQ